MIRKGTFQPNFNFTKISGARKHHWILKGFFIKVHVVQMTEKISYYHCLHTASNRLLRVKNMTAALDKKGTLDLE